MSVQVWKLSETGEAPDLQPVALPQPAETLNDASAALPGGAYTTLRTYGRVRALRLPAHFARLEETARLAGYPLELPLDRLRRALATLAQAEDLPGSELRFRLTVDLEHKPGRIFIAAEALTVPSPADYENGVMVVTASMERRDPKAKLTRFISRAAAVRSSLPEGVDEALMVNPAGFVLEGLSSNFFGFLDGILRTAEEGVLLGVTRGLALDAARRLDLPIRLEPLQRSELAMLDEAFLTGTSRGVLPIRRIDSLDLGAPGALTRRLMGAFDALLQKELAPFV